MFFKATGMGVSFDGPLVVATHNPGKAREIASVSPSSVKATKRVLNALDDLEQLKASLLYSREVMADLRNTEDFSEGVNAFVEKRKPEWKNR